MTKLISTNEKIPVYIDDIIIYVSPLTYMEKTEIQNHMSLAIKGDMTQAMRGAVAAIKYAVKDIKGVVDSDDKPFKLEFEENGKHLTDSCVDNLLNLPQNHNMITTCISLLDGIPVEGIKDPITGIAVEGVTFGDFEGKNLNKRVSGD